MNPAISTLDVCKTYLHEGRPVHALRGVSLDVPVGKFVALMGSSGCGKSTLLNVIGGIDIATSGSVVINGKDVRGFSDIELTLLRRREIGLIFQFFNLMPTLTVLENVALPALLDGRETISAMDRASELLKDVGLEGRLDHLPHELSGGEMQRTAIARSLINDPTVILADEPTGNLDSRNAEHVMDVLHAMARRSTTALLVATHSAELARNADSTLRMKDGVLVDA